MNRTIFLAALSLACTNTYAAAAADALTEQDFLGEMPVVLSVSRLAQRLDETPGAMTILDRQFIRMSGARDVADLLRLVPGFQTTTSYETDAPLASYHGRVDDWANRIQVLVDGRSVYSGFLAGSAGMGWKTLALDDIERIEVLRGSNSAAYGARAFLGVVNIVSMAPSDTLGQSVSMTGGSLGVGDASARLGWGGTEAQYRLSFASEGDQGLRGTAGINRSNRVNFSGHFALGSTEDLDIRAGGLDIQAGRGSSDYGEWGNPARIRYMGSRFVQADWHKNVSQDNDIAVVASHTEYIYRDSFPYLNPAPPYAPYYGISIAFNGNEQNDALTVQQTVRQSPTMRTVWGAELRQEQLRSRSSFDLREQVTSNFQRVFGNFEWRMMPDLLLNAGVLGEHSDIGGDSVSPRVMLNWNVAQGQTLRAGVSQAFRPPSAFEKYADVKYYDTSGQNPLTYSIGNPDVTSEHIRSSEMGYFLNLPERGISADARIFREQVSDGVYCSTDIEPSICTNQDNYTIRGLEYQLNWRPAVSTRVFWSQVWTQIDGVDVPLTNLDSLGRHRLRVIRSTPTTAGSLVLMHTLDSGWSLSLAHHHIGSVALNSEDITGQLHSMWRTDLRIAKAFRWGKNHAELALVVQDVDAPYQDGGVNYYFDQRAFVTLRLEQ